MSTLLMILLATTAVSLISFIGVFTLSLSKKAIERLLLVFVALAAGGLLGGAFLHLIPESFEHHGESVFVFVLAGFILFLLLEQFLHWHHGHHGEHCCGDPEHKQSKKALSSLILIGDSLHNFLDGLVIATAFLVSTEVGIIATIAIALHEIPQEIGDFGVLVYSGMKRVKALLFNFGSALFALLGGLVGFGFSEVAHGLEEVILPLAAGGFIYLAASDLIPELKHATTLKRRIIHIFVLILGLALMYSLAHVPFLPHGH